MNGNESKLLQERSRKNHTIKFISLLSGGLDSPIAAYLMMKKKFSPVFLSFLTSDDEENSMKKKVVRIVQILAQLTDEKLKLYFINHDHNLERFKRRCERKLTCILCKRLMIRIAKEIGREVATVDEAKEILGIKK